MFEASTGRSVRLEPILSVGGPADWSPAHGPSSLILLDQHGLVVDGTGPSRILLFDLARNRVEDLGPIELLDEPSLPHQLRGLSELAVAPDGRSALCGSNLGLSGPLPHVLGPQTRVSLLDPVQGLPDLVFTANAAMIYRRHALISRFRHRQRQGEEPYNRKWFAENIMN